MANTLAYTPVSGNAHPTETGADTSGNDIIYAGAGNDRAWGGLGDDTYVIESGFANRIDAREGATWFV